MLTKKLDRRMLLLVLLALLNSGTVSGTSPTILIVKKHSVQIDGKSSELFKIEQPDGTWGYHGTKGQFFDAIVKNKTNVPTVVHWHGLILPNDQDGVPYVTQLPIPAGGEYHYHFKLVQSGTYWMHSHFGLQEQQLLSAPLIISDPEKTAKEKDVVLFISDFSYRKPTAILADLKNSNSKHQPVKLHAKKLMKMKPKLNDVTYDAFLTNYRTLRNPEIIRVKPGETVRLRVIAGSSMSNFFIKTGTLSGQAIAVDGHDIQPIKDNVFQLAVAQRIDIQVKIPNKEGSYPILAEGEGTSMQTGLILATSHATIKLPNEHADKVSGALDYAQELKIKALSPLKPKPPYQTLMVRMEGNMMKYIWTLNHEIWPRVMPLRVKENKRIEVILQNDTQMAHPIHLHGHVFEVTEINGQKLINGAMRDTVMVLPGTTVKIQFDAKHPGNWVMHCHMLYHMATGMVTLVNYDGVDLPPWLNFK